MNISIPDELKARMDGADVNWSAVAAAGFDKRLREIEKTEVNQMDEKVINRLRESKAEYEKEMTEWGKELGQRWAESRAEYSDFVTLERAVEDYMKGPGTYALFQDDRLESAMSSDERGSFWHDNVGLNDIEMGFVESRDFVEAFVESALSVYHEVDKVLA